jgi:hypothetical protein
MDQLLRNTNLYHDQAERVHALALREHDKKRQLVLLAIAEHFYLLHDQLVELGHLQQRQAFRVVSAPSRPE